MEPLYRRLAALADPVRGRILTLLARHELNVSELCAAVQLPQSTASRQLKQLAAAGWVVSRADGTSRYYRLSPLLDGPTWGMWQAVREELSSSAESRQDEVRAREAVAGRRTRSQEFFTTGVAQWDALRAELFGARAELAALPGLLDAAWVVGDLGCGTGQVTATVAPCVGRVIAVDQSQPMLAAARGRLLEHENVELRHGDLESLPVEAATLDAAVIFLVLHYLADPPAALREAARVLKPGGRLLVVDMIEHGRLELLERMGHVWPGFRAEVMEEWLTTSGFTGARGRALPPAPEAKGPLLFTVAAVRAPAAGKEQLERSGPPGPRTNNEGAEHG